jgi:tRNA (guanine-N7-)-methyltransferase
MKPRYLSLTPLVPWMEKERPIEWRQEFGRSAELEVEIGFGLGDFLVRQALEEPEKDFVGIEIGWVPVRRALRKTALAGVRNVRIIKVDAQVAFERLFSEKSLGRAYALFPCPWPKKKHVKHRLFSRAFLKLLNSRLKDDGEVSIVTDHPSYFEWVQSQVSGTGLEAYPKTVAPQFSTKYERKWEALGQQQFYELRLIKRRHVEVPLKEDIKVRTYSVDHFEPEGFMLSDERGEITVEFKEILYDPKREKALVRALVAEDGLIQNPWIEITRVEDSWHIRPAKGSIMVPTAGVQRTLDLVRDAALSRKNG